jgi:hypothetical protein
MARQESQSKLLYYPTPPMVVELIATWLSAGQGLTRLADPCVGQGEALHTLAGQISTGGNFHGGKLETWGIELSYARAEIAAKVIDTVLPTSFYATSWAPRSVSLVWNNPPYDWSDTVDEKGKRMRHEALFATKCTPKLVDGGIHVLIVPQRILTDETLSRHWTGWYEQSLLFRFPDGEFEAFGQVVLIGRVRARYQPPTKAQIESFQAYGQPDVELSPLIAGDGRYVLPAAPATARFSYTPFDDETMVRAAAPTNLLGTPDWERATFVRPIGAPINPLVQLKIGHLSMLISAGELGVVSLDLPEGRSLVKGTLTKTITRSEEPVLNEDGEVSGIRVEERERMESVITLLHAEGQRQRLSGTQEVADFITRHASTLADAVLDRNRPFYDWQPAHCEWDKAARTALGLPPLPGRSERGLFDVQKHFAIAAARRMRARHHVVFNCEMGWGKTCGAVGTLEQRDRWPALVMCPGHMVEKWRRDLETASNPADPIHARIITRPARAESSWFHEHVSPVLAECGVQTVSDDRWQVPSSGENDNGLRRRLTLTVGLEQRRFLIDRLTKLLTVKGRGDNPTVRPTIRQELSGLTVEFVDRDDYTLADFFADFDQGRLGRKAVAVIAFEPAKYDAGMASIDLPRRWMRLWDEREGLTVLAKVPCCPGCGQLLGVKEDGGKLVAQAPLVPSGLHFELRPSIPATCPYVFSEPVLDETGRPVLQNGQPPLASRDCNTRLYEMSRWRRVGLSRLIQRQYPHRFQVYIADEVHESKGSDTDIGTADGRFLSSIRDSLALTGTLFGGTASSLFYLLYRRSPEVRQLYGYKDASRWIDHYGLRKYRWTEKPNGTDRGASSAVTRWDVRPPQELPGVSPAVIRFLLPLTLFGKITDLGYTLPGLADKVQAVDMGEALGSQYREASSVLLQKALDRLRTESDAGLLTTWFTTVRYRPMSAFRDEVVTFKGEAIMSLPAVVFDEREHLPKEEKLAELVQTNLRLGRKTLVFVEQTGTWDIRSRLKAVLRQRVPGANVQMLSANDMRPSKRELWIKRNAPLMDCLMVNAGLVKTGLDLVMFSDIVFYETNTSLYTVWQAMRRVWRLGQKLPVTTTFLAYDAAVETALLDLMGEKMKAAMLLYGDNAAGALVDSDGEDDLAREMIRRALDGKTIEAAGAVDGQSLFGGETVVAIPVSDSPMGSPVAASPSLPVLAAEPLLSIPGQVQQLDLFGGLVNIAVTRKRR